MIIKYITNTIKIIQNYIRQNGHFCIGLYQHCN